MSAGDLPRWICARCDQPGIFGYRDQNGKLIWYCTQHRLAQYWADARMPSPLADQSNGASTTNDNAYQQTNLVAAESTGRALPNTLDVPPWDRPGAVMDGQLALRATNFFSRPKPIAANRAPHFDDAGRFIHPCRECGRDAHFGIRVNLCAGELGVWYCATCKPEARGND
jgi:hypothetical protein